jgi:hypothetical protein
MEALKQLARERNIDEYEMLDKLEQSLASTYQRIMDLENPTRVTIDRETGAIYVYELIPQGEIDEETGQAESYEEKDITPADVSRIAAQACAGEILIPEPLRHLLSGKMYVYADRGETMLKGFEDAVRLYEVRWRD